MSRKRGQVVFLGLLEPDPDRQSWGRDGIVLMFHI